MYKRKTIGVVVPAYNEARFVGSVIETIPEYVDRIYAVDDCSTDGTWSEITSVAQQVNGERETESGVTQTTQFSDRVVPIRHEVNRGVGNSIKTGYRYALEDGIDVVAVMAGDGQMDPTILHRILDPIVEGKAGYAKGNRLLNSESREEMPRFRIFGNMILTLLTRISTGYWQMADPQNGYTAISTRALEAIDLDDMYGEYGYCNDLLARLNVARVRVADVEMTAKYGDETSHISYPTYITKVSGLLLRNFLWRLKEKHLSSASDQFRIANVLGMFVISLGILGIPGLFVTFALVSLVVAVRKDEQATESAVVKVEKDG